MTRLYEDWHPVESRSKQAEHPTNKQFIPIKLLKLNLFSTEDLSLNWVMSMKILSMKLEAKGISNRSNNLKKLISKTRETETQKLAKIYWYQLLTNSVIMHQVFARSYHLKNFQIHVNVKKLFSRESRNWKARSVDKSNDKKNQMFELKKKTSIFYKSNQAIKKNINRLKKLI